MGRCRRDQAQRPGSRARATKLGRTAARAYQRLVAFALSLTFATQLTAVATAVLAVFAIVTAFYVRQAFRKQSQEVSATERQVKDQ